MCRVTDIENHVKSKADEMLRKMKPGVVYSQGEIDVYGSIDAQAFSKLLLEKKIEFIPGQQRVRLVLFND